MRFSAASSQMRWISEGSGAMTPLDADIETTASPWAGDCPIRIPDFRSIWAGTAADKEGELCTRGRTIFTGYFKSPEEMR